MQVRAQRTYLKTKDAAEGAQAVEGELLQGGARELASEVVQRW